MSLGAAALLSLGHAFLLPQPHPLSPPGFSPQSSGFLSLFHSHPENGSQAYFPGVRLLVPGLRVSASCQFPSAGQHLKQTLHLPFRLLMAHDVFQA